MKVGVGGTFNVLHRGHKALLDRAFEVGDEVLIGITSDVFASSTRREVETLDERRSAVERYLINKKKPWTISVIDDFSGNITEDRTIGALIVSPMTYPTARVINQKRTNMGLFPFELVKIDEVLAEDCTPISATRIVEGEIDPEGRMLRTMRVAVGSDNINKVAAVQNIMYKLYHNVDVQGMKVKSTVSEQPRGQETVKGAVARAFACIGNADFGVGLEAGVFEMDQGLYDLQYCAILDKRGVVTVGHGSGFKYPPEVAERVRKGDTIGQAFKDLYGWEKDGKKEGAISYLTNGLLKRTELAEQAVMAAMVPRIRRELYPDL